jgi:hypothetical protein
MADANFTLWSAGRFDRCATTNADGTYANVYEDVPLVHAAANHELPGTHRHDVALHDGPRKLASQLSAIGAGYLVGLMTLPNGSRLRAVHVAVRADEGATFDLQLKSGAAFAPETMKRVSYDAADVATVAGGAVTGIDGPAAGEQRVYHTFYWDKGLITHGNADEVQLKFAAVPAGGLLKLPKVYVRAIYEHGMSHWM